MRILRTAAAFIALAATIMTTPALANMEEVSAAVDADYDSYLAPLFVHFHKNPELSYLENKTAARMAQELRATGLEVTEGVGARALSV